MIGIDEINNIVNRIISAIDYRRNYNSKAVRLSSELEETVSIKGIVSGYGIKVFSGNVLITFSDESTVSLDSGMDLYWKAGNLNDIKFTGSSTPDYIVYWNEK